MMRLVTVLATLLVISPSLWAGDFYIDPEHGEPAGDGSADKPWRSLQETLDRGLVQSRNLQKIVGSMVVYVHIKSRQVPPNLR